MSQLISVRPASFRPRLNFQFDDSLHWFVGHMSKAKIKLNTTVKRANVLVEVRDARIPLSSFQHELVDILQRDKEKAHVILLNKSDLVTPEILKRAVTLIQASTNARVIPTVAIQSKKIGEVLRCATELGENRWKSLGVWMLVCGLPNVGKSSIIQALKNQAYNSSKNGNFGNKAMHGVKQAPLKISRQAGTTQQVSYFQIRANPHVYCYDSPGITFLKSEVEWERNAKLAACGLLNPQGRQSFYVADYILYRLNLAHNFDYVRVLEMEAPTNDIQEVLTHMASLMAGKANHERITDQVSHACSYFNTLFQEGQFGLMCLDDLPKTGDYQKLVDLQGVKEPPGPWGPESYPLDLTTTYLTRQVGGLSKMGNQFHSTKYRKKK